MEKKLFIGNLPFEATEDKLKELFSDVGEVVSVNIITDRNTGRSRGFGFVEMSSEDEAKTAVEKLDGHELEGRNLKVNEARPMKERRGGPGEDEGGFGG